MSDKMQVLITKEKINTIFKCLLKCVYRQEGEKVCNCTGKNVCTIFREFYACRNIFLCFFMSLYKNLKTFHLFVSQRLVCAPCRNKMLKLNISREFLIRFYRNLIIFQQFISLRILYPITMLHIVRSGHWWVLPDSYYNI